MSMHEEMLIADKKSCRILVSEEMLMDVGVIPDTRPPLKVTRMQRIGWRMSQIRICLAELAYQLISGQPFPEGDYW